MRVLIVEDYPDSARMLTAVVRSFGHDCDWASDGERALQLAACRHPDVVLLDIGLPGMDGYTIAKKLRQDVGLTETKIVALSGFVPVLSRMIESSIDEYRMKPISVQAVKDVLASSVVDP